MCGSYGDGSKEVEKMKCKIEGCDKSARKKGLCSKHYKQERRKDPEFRKKENQIQERYRQKRLTEDPESFKLYKNKAARKHIAKRKAEDPEGFRQFVSKQNAKCKAKKKAEHRCCRCGKPLPKNWKTFHCESCAQKYRIKKNKRRGLNSIPLVFINWGDYEIDWHHTNDNYMVPVPREIHKSMLGVGHREKVNAWFENITGLSISDLIADVKL